MNPLGIKVKKIENEQFVALKNESEGHCIKGK